MKTFHDILPRNVNVYFPHLYHRSEPTEHFANIPLNKENSTFRKKINETLSTIHDFLTLWRNDATRILFNILTQKLFKTQRGGKISAKISPIQTLTSIHETDDNLGSCQIQTVTIHFSRRVPTRVGSTSSDIFCSKPRNTLTVSTCHIIHPNDSKLILTA
jgi:hypothetical protein